MTNPVSLNRAGREVGVAPSTVKKWVSQEKVGVLKPSAGRGHPMLVDLDQVATVAQERRIGHPTTLKWDIRPFSEFLDNIGHLDDIVHVAVTGIRMLQAVPRMIKAVEYAQGKVNADEFAEGKVSNVDRLVAAEKQAELAKAEVENGFPMIYSNAVINLWSLLEGMVSEFVVALLRNDSSALQVREVQQLRIRLVEYQQLSEEDRFSYIAEMLEKEVAAGLRNGTARFEAMLRPFDLGGEVPEKIGQTIWELGQIRNALVHRSGIADRRFIEACPWLKMNLGHEIRISHKMFGDYIGSSCAYVTLLINRVTERRKIVKETLSSDLAAT